MPKNLIQVAGFDRGGVVLDSDRFSLNQTEWSDARNVRFDNRSVSKITGEETLASTSNRPNESIYWQQPGSNPNRIVYVDEVGILRTFIPGDTSDNALNSTSLSTTNRIDLNLFNGGATLILNDSSGAPWYINSPDFGTIPQAAILRNSVGWEESNFVSGATNISAAVVRPFNQVLMAANLTYTTGSGNVYGPSTIRISNIPVDLITPPTWTLSDSSIRNKASDFQLSTNAPIIDMIPFQGVMAVYTSDSIWHVNVPTSATAPATIVAQQSGRGMLAKNCGVEYQGRHFVVGNNDIYRYGGGSSATSIADGRVRDTFFERLQPGQEDKTFVVHHSCQSEIWVNYVRRVEGQTPTDINEVLIFNYDNNTWTFRDAAGFSGVTTAPPIVGGVFSDDATRSVVFSDATNNEFVIADRGNSFRGSNINAYVERKGFDVSPGTVNAKKWNDSTYYIITGSGDVTVQARSTDTPGRPVDFTSTADRYIKTRTFSLDPDMGDYKVDYRTSGRYYNTRVGSNDSTGEWSLIRYSMAIEVDDER